MELKKYQIIFNTVINGKPCIRPCTKKTKSGAWCICYSKDESKAKNRVAELIEAGYDASYRELPKPMKKWFVVEWFDDEYGDEYGKYFDTYAEAVAYANKNKCPLSGIYLKEVE